MGERVAIVDPFGRDPDDPGYVMEIATALAAVALGRKRLSVMKRSAAPDPEPQPPERPPERPADPPLVAMHDSTRRALLGHVKYRIRVMERAQAFADRQATHA